MELSLTDLTLLIQIGKNPFLSIDELAEAVDLTKRSVSSNVSRFRTEGYVLKTVREEDRDEGLQRELTFKGWKAVQRSLFDLMGDLGVVINPGLMHWHRPPHARDREYAAKIKVLKMSRGKTEEIRERARAAAKELA